MITHNTSDLFIGARLSAARALAGISLEKAAKDTRIRLQCLREIESDDFSGFAHPTYTRLFLRDYAQYLGVPEGEIRPMLPETIGIAAGGFKYLDVLAESFTPLKTPPRLKSRLLRILKVGVILIILLIGGFYFWSTLKKIERVAGWGVSPSPTSVVGQGESAESKNAGPTVPPNEKPPIEPKSVESTIEIQEVPSPISSETPPADPLPEISPTVTHPTRDIDPITTVTSPTL